MSVQELITENLDLWTGAVTKKSSSGRGSNGKVELTGVKKLRALILELAVRGKLVEQVPGDKTAHELIEAIADLKQQKILEGALPKLKNFKSDTEHVPPYDAPKLWVLAPLGDLTLQITDGVHHTPQYLPSGVPFISVKDIDGRTVSFRDCKYISEEQHKEINKRCNPEKGDILLCRIGTLGRATVVDTDAPFSLFVSVGLLKMPTFLISSRYVHLALHSPFVLQQMDQIKAGGSHTNKLNLGAIPTLHIPVPPMEEQHRIVQKVDELMALCDRLEQQSSDQLEAHEILVDSLLDTLTQSENATELADNWARLAAHFDTLFTTEQSIDKLKQTILQLAVMGRLVEQDERDEPASILLNKIEEIERRLLAAGRIRRKKPGKTITNQSLQQLPKGWALTSLSQLGRFSGGKTPSKSKSQFWDGEIPWVTPKDMKVQYITGSEDKVTQLAVDEGLELYSENAILFVVRSGILRRMFPTAISRVPCTVNQDLKVLTPHASELSEYIQLMMLGFEQFILSDLTKTGTTVESLKFEEFANCQFPIPPRQEQVRIIQRVQELTALCNQLKEHLNHASETRYQLAEAVVEGALS